MNIFLYIYAPCLGYFAFILLKKGFNARDRQRFLEIWDPLHEAAGWLAYVVLAVAIAGAALITPLALLYYASEALREYRERRANGGMLLCEMPMLKTRMPPIAEELEAALAQAAARQDPACSESLAEGLAKQAAVKHHPLFPTDEEIAAALAQAPGLAQAVGLAQDPAPDTVVPGNGLEIHPPQSWVLIPQGYLFVREDSQMAIAPETNPPYTHIRVNRTYGKPVVEGQKYTARMLYQFDGGPVCEGLTDNECYAGSDGSTATFEIHETHFLTTAEYEQLKANGLAFSHVAFKDHNAVLNGTGGRREFRLRLVLVSEEKAGTVE